MIKKHGVCGKTPQGMVYTSKNVQFTVANKDKNNRWEEEGLWVNLCLSQSEKNVTSLEDKNLRKFRLQIVIKYS